jgi:hypothetical protein
MGTSVGAVWRRVMKSSAEKAVEICREEREQAWDNKWRVVELEAELAETEQYLAMADGQADGGRPGWTMPLSDVWRRHTDNGWILSVERGVRAGGWIWILKKESPRYTETGERWVEPGDWPASVKGTAPTIREAIAAAEAAYQEAVNG